jgi:hypothetical protein
MISGPATVSFVGIAFLLLIGGVWILGAICFPFAIRRAPLWLRLVSVVASVLMASGAIGFFGSGLSAFGGLNWLPPSFEWPVGHANGVVTTADGLHVVPLDAPGRVQVYDANWRFLRGWAVDTGGKPFKLQISPDRHIEVFGTRTHEVYTLQGALVRSEPFPDTADAYNAIPNGASCAVPTPIWLWVFAGPFASWATALVGLLLLVLTQRLAKPYNLSTPPANLDEATSREVIVLSEPEHVSVRRQDPLDSGATIPGQFSAGSYGCLGAISIWTLGWVTVAYLAVSRAWRSPDGSAILGAIVSGLVAFVGCRVSVALLKTHSPGNVISVSSYVSMPRRLIGWVAALVWFAAAVVWNLGVFATLFKLAQAGRGWTVLLLLLWSLVGLFLLFVLLTGIGVTIDSLLRSLRRRDDSGGP